MQTLAEDFERMRSDFKEKKKRKKTEGNSSRDGLMSLLLWLWMMRETSSPSQLKYLDSCSTDQSTNIKLNDFYSC